LTEAKGFFEEAPGRMSSKRLSAFLSFIVGAALAVGGIFSGWEPSGIAVAVSPFLTLTATLLVGGNLSERKK